METKIVNTVFNISEFEEETEWLSDMQSQGWKLTGISCNKYKFEKCEPEEWVYQLDFQRKNIENDNYIKLFTDYGWEFILLYNNWFYFRKKKDQTDPDVSIFSDRESKIAMCERLISGKLAVNIGIFTISCFIVALSMFTDIFHSEALVLFPNNWINDFIKAALPWIGTGLFVATSFSYFSYRNIKLKINRMKNPID